MNYNHPQELTEVSPMQQESLNPGLQLASERLRPFVQAREEARAEPETLLETFRTKEGFHRARFGFDFIGMRRQPDKPFVSPGDKPEASSVPPSAIPTLVKLLRPGDSLTFAYVSLHGRRLVWKIIGETKAAESAAEAREAGMGLHGAVQAVLRTIGGGCRFHACAVAGVQSGKDHAASAYAYHISPSAIGVEASIREGAIGFGVGAKPPENLKVRLGIPCPVPGSGVSIPELVVSSNISVCLAVTIEAASLTSRQRNALGCAVELLKKDVAQSAHTPARCSDELPAHPELLAKLGEELLRHGGVRMRCSATAHTPVSAAWLNLIGQEVFGSQVDVHEGKPFPDEGNGEFALEDHRPLSARPPDLFLDEGAANRVAVPMCFEPEDLGLPESGITLGELVGGGSAQVVRLHDSCRSRHCYVIGATGTGKSTLLYNLIQQDIWAGHGVALLDPHGDLFDQVLASIPKKRAKDVVILDPTDRERAVGLNFLEVSGGNRAVEEAFIVSELLSCFERMYDMRVVGGPAFEQYFRNSLLLLMSGSEETPTLLDVQRLFEDKDWRRGLLQRCPSHQVKGFWRMAEATTGEHGLCNFGPYITNKLTAFTHHAVLRPIIGQRKSTLRFRELMDRRRILLVNLSKGVLGERDAQFLGMLVFAKLSQAALSRHDLPPAKRTPFHLYVDEFQNLATNSIGVMLAEARKYGVSLTLANQNTAQLVKSGEYLLETVLGNVGSLVAFRLGVPDAERLQPYFRPDLGAADLQRLGNHLAAARLMKPQGPTAPFIFHTLPPEPPKGALTRVAGLRRLRHRYTEPIVEIEHDITRRFASKVSSTASSQAQPPTT